MKNHKNLLSEKEQTRLYFVHHMHHLKSRQNARHELHHCFLFSQKNMKGERYQIKHLLSGNKLSHVLDRTFSGKLYDHQNRAFKIVKKRTFGKTEAVFE
ncbi:MAG: hypothetical protein V1845_01110 [bacterium]